MGDITFQAHSVDLPRLQEQTIPINLATQDNALLASIRTVNGEVSKITSVNVAHADYLNFINSAH